MYTWGGQKGNILVNRASEKFSCTNGEKRNATTGGKL